MSSLGLPISWSGCDAAKAPEAERDKRRETANPPLLYLSSHRIGVGITAFSTDVLSADCEYSATLHQGLDLPSISPLYQQRAAAKTAAALLPPADQEKFSRPPFQ